MHGKCSGKVASLPTGNDTALKDIIGFKLFFHVEEAGLRGCLVVLLGNCFPTIRRDAPPSPQGS
jgi:hypothetical protein